MVQWRAAAGSIVAGLMLTGCGGGGGEDTGSATTGASVTAGTDSSDPTGGPNPSDASVTGEATDSGATSGTSTGATTSPTGGESSESGGEPVTCTDECHYIRALADGDGSGSDWENAMPALPDTLERGHVYFIGGAADYPAYTFDDAEAGTTMIRVLRATGDDHGTDVGWHPDFGTGQVTFGGLVFASGYHEFDGRGATRAVGAYEGTVVDIAGSGVHFRNVDVDGAFAEEGGKHTGGACTGMSITGDDVVVSGNRIHDAADDGVSMAALHNLSFAGNVVHALHGCGTDGECGPCYNGHSDGLELFDVVDSEIVGNLIYGITSTSAVFFGNWADELGEGPAEYCENVLLANNIFYSPETGFVAYLEDVRGISVINNVMWGLHQGAYGGLSIGTNVADLDLYNNVILSINYTHIGGAYDPAEHRGDHNLFAYSLGQWQDGPNDVVAEDPLFMAIPGGEGPIDDSPQPEDFAPQAGSPMRDAGFAGDANVVVPATDFFGLARDATPNLGAIE
jgi:hypothetical protein